MGLFDEDVARDRLTVEGRAGIAEAEAEIAMLRHAYIQASSLEGYVVVANTPWAGSEVPTFEGSSYIALRGLTTA
jgi:hypothetical protein